MTPLHPERVHLIWAAVAFVALLFWLERRGGAALARFVGLAMQPALVRRLAGGRRLARLGLVLATLVLGTVALMRPQGRVPVPQAVAGRKAADVLFVLDVSRSMLAADAAPSRLERAKAEIRDLAVALDGNRLGLVAFAGRAAVLTPLTPDVGFFRMVLDGVDTDSVGRGGTRVGDALRKAVSAFPPGPGGKLIVLMTDGEDHDSYPVDAAREARRAGVRIVTIGFGEEEGSEITVVDRRTGAREVVKDASGQPVRSRLDGETLRQVALETEGAYVPAGTGVLDLESIVKTHIEPLLDEPAPDTVRMAKVERYPWFLLGALGCLLGAAWAGSLAGRARA